MADTNRENSHELPEGDSPRSSFNLFHVAWRRKSLLALGTMVGLVLAGLYFAQQRPVYQSSAKILVIKKQPDALPIQGLDTRQTFIEDYVATQLTIIKSPLIVGRAVQKSNLRELSWFQGVEDPASVIIQSLTVSREKDSSSPTGASNIINLSCRGPVARDCATVLAAIIHSYTDFLHETYQNVGDDAVSLITSARDVMQKDLTRTKAAYSAFKKTSPVLLQSKDGTSLHQERLASLDARRADLLLRRAETEGRLRAIEAAAKEGRDLIPFLEAPLENGKGNAAAARQAVLTRLDEQLLPLLLREEALLETRGKDHPDVKDVRRRIQMLRDFAQKQLTGGTWGKHSAGKESRPSPDLVKARVEALKQELEDLRVAEQVLNGIFEKEYTTTKKLTDYEVQDQEFRRQIDLTQQLYHSILKRLQEVDLIKNYGGYTARTISPPEAGGQVAPKPLPIFGLGFVAGLLVGLALAVLAEASDRTFRSPQEVRRALRLPLVGHIPLLKPDPSARRLVADGEVVLDPLLCTYHQSASVGAEAFRGVRTALYFSTDGGRHRVIQITSPNREDGKTTVAANLAVSIAQSGKGVLLIDADFRRPRIHRMFGLSAETGLAAVLEGQAPLDTALLKTTVPNLSVLPCGPLPLNPADLLTSPRLKEVLDLLRQRYEFIIVDTPPLLAVSDPAVVAPRVDGVLLALRLSRNGRPAAERAREVLAALRVNVFGVITTGEGWKEAGDYGPSYSSAYGDSAEPRGEDRPCPLPRGDMNPSPGEEAAVGV